MKTTLIVLNSAALICAFLWLIVDATWEPIVASLGLLGTLVGLIYDKDSDNDKTKMIQKGGKNSKNYQAGNDINISNDKR